MFKPTMFTLCFSLSTYWASYAAVAAEPLVASEYRLSTENAGSFRLAGREAPAPLPEPTKETAIPAHLAGMPYATLIENAARKAALDPALVHALIYVESRYNPSARSPKGAIGLMQVLPETASRYGVHNPGHSPEVNLRVGTSYLSDLMQMFDNRLDLALAAYNAGENAVMRYGQRIPPYRETQLYVPAVLAKYNEWRTAPLEVVNPIVPPPKPARIEYLPGTRLNPSPPSVVMSGDGP